jgi:ATP-dependent DNA helicase RecG
MNLNLPITSIKGVAAKTAEPFTKAGIHTVRDLIYYFPRTYENYQVAQQIADIKPGKVTIRATVENIKTAPTRRRNFTITEATLRDKSGAVKAVWFNQSYRAKQFDPKKEYYFSGNFDFSHGKYQLISPSAVLSDSIDASSSTIQPIYRESGKLKSITIKKTLSKLRPMFASIPDLIPNMPGRANALFNIHFPETEEDIKIAENHLSLEELFELILASTLNRQESAKLRAASLPFSAENTKSLVKKLPFTLTDAQRRATWDILQDLGKKIPMNRLLQGDVGSGKTVVAAIAAHQVAASNHQTALLAPTEILANQHAETISKLLSPFGITVALLTGSTKNKSALKKHIASGEVQVIIGTHALLTDDTKFHSLALAIIDEQHRFGVAQRQKLLLKSSKLAPHLLSMTATPIPRSLQLTIFGDLDVSILNELPKGRQKIATKILRTTDSTDILYPAIKNQLGKDHQIYYICKIIEDSPLSEAASVKKQAEKLERIFSNHIVATLHGKMKSAEKDNVMRQFIENKINILVSTTVVEVGVDVPNATIIVIDNAELYGLAQLHQLRGRVGRGSVESYCYLLIGAESTPSRRLRELEKSTDGFHLAEVDLQLRGPGEIYGSLQHGILDLRIATLSDTATIMKAQRAVKAFLARGIDVLQYKELATSVQKYQRLTTLN